MQHLSQFKLLGTERKIWMQTKTQLEEYWAVYYIQKQEHGGQLIDRDGNNQQNI